MLNLRRPKGEDSCYSRADEKARTLKTGGVREGEVVSLEEEEALGLGPYY
jgi:hypothetical protein